MDAKEERWIPSDLCPRHPALLPPFPPVLVGGMLVSQRLPFTAHQGKRWKWHVLTYVRLSACQALHFLLYPIFSSPEKCRGGCTVSIYTHLHFLHSFYHKFSSP